MARLLLVHPTGGDATALTGPYDSLVLGSIATAALGMGWDVDLVDVAHEAAGQEAVLTSGQGADVVVIDVLYRTFDAGVATAADLRRRTGDHVRELRLDDVAAAFPGYEVHGGRLSGGGPWIGLCGLGARARAAEVLAHSPAVDFVLVDAPDLEHRRAVRPHAAANALARGIIDIEATRGCTHGCRFCAVGARMPGRRDRRWVPRPPADVVDEIVELTAATGVRRVGFVDDNLLGAPRASEVWLDELARELACTVPDLVFSAYLRADSCTEEVVDRLVSVGLVQARLGVESGSDSLLARMGKGCTSATTARAIRLLRSRDVEVVPSLIAFAPDQSIEETVESLEWFAAMGLERGFGPSTFIPLPGAELTAELEARGLLTHGDPLGLPTARLVDPAVEAVVAALRQMEEDVESTRPGWLEAVGRARFRHEDRLGVVDGPPAPEVVAHDAFRREELQVALAAARHGADRSMSLRRRSPGAHS